MDRDGGARRAAGPVVRHGVKDGLGEAGAVPRAAEVDSREEPGARRLYCPRGAGFRQYLAEGRAEPARGHERRRARFGHILRRDRGVARFDERRHQRATGRAAHDRVADLQAADVRQADERITFAKERLEAPQEVHVHVRVDAAVHEQYVVARDVAFGGPVARFCERAPRAAVPPQERRDGRAAPQHAGPARVYPAKGGAALDQRRRHRARPEPDLMKHARNALRRRRRPSEGLVVAREAREPGVFVVPPEVAPWGLRCFPGGPVSSLHVAASVRNATSAPS